MTEEIKIWILRNRVGDRYECALVMATSKKEAVEIVSTLKGEKWIVPGNIFLLESDRPGLIFHGWNV